MVAYHEEADYLGVGPIFETSSKDDADDPLGLKVLENICDEIDIPVIAIGGISLQNISDVKKAGVDGVAVISAITREKDIVLATRKIAKALRGQIDYTY